MVMTSGMPSTSEPTSVSSMLPSKIRSFMSATVATVVPSFMVLAWMTELPTLTGTLRMRPVMVERTSVLDEVAFDCDTPSRITSRASCAAARSSLAWASFCVTWSISSALTRFLSKSAFSRS